MKYKFENIFLDEKELLSLNSEMIDPVLIENNKSQIKEVYEFYKNEHPLLYVNGFLGTGKVQLVNYSLNFLSQDTVVLKHNCFETTILDDIFLTFFEEFKKLEAQKIIVRPNIKSENFNQKIHSYFSTIEKPILIVLDSFESLIEENRKEIIDFLLHLISFHKVKTILVGRTFKASQFPENLTIDRVSTTPLEKPLFEKYLKNNKVKYNQKVLDDLYKYTRGYHFFINLTLEIIKEKQLTPEAFLENFKKSFMNFYEYLEKESIDLIPAIAVRFFWLLCLFRHGVSITLLKQLKLYDEDVISILLKNKILTKENNQIYVQDYFKEQIDVTIPQKVALKLHQNIIDIYEAQLPLRPLERTILLSRQTMRKEIEYHSLFLPKKQIAPNEYGSGLTYVNYTKEANKQHTPQQPQQNPIQTNNIQQGATQQPTQQNNSAQQGHWVSTKDYSQQIQQQGQQQSQQASQPAQQTNVDLSKLGFDVKDLPFKLTPQEMEMLAASVASIQEAHEKNSLNLQQTQSTTPQQPQQVPQQNNEPDEEIKITLEDIVNFAKQQEAEYQYAKMIELYQKALTYTDDNDYYNYLPLIYTKLGLAYQKMSDWENSLKYYELAREFYEQTTEKVKENYIKLNIANIYYETYKPDKAKALLMDIINSNGMPEILITKTYIAFANIEDSMSNINSAYEYYKKAIALSNSTMDTETQSELYFKFALIADDKNDTQSALEYYNKCINLSSDKKLNKYLSAAYSNLATLYFERNEVQTAAKYFTKAYELDESNSNYDGMYFSATKLAQLAQKNFPEKAIEYLVKAKECAKKLNDTFYIASAVLATGDFYYSRKENEMALREYLSAFEIAKNEFSKDNLSKIQMRIDDIKFRIGLDAFSKIETEFKNGQH